MNWSIQSLEKRHLGAAAQLAESYYGIENDIADKAYLDHEYFENPYGPALARIAWDEINQIAAGQYVIIPMHVKVGQAVRESLMSVNTLTGKDYRGQGVFTALAKPVFEEAERRGFSLIYGMPNQNSYPNFTRHLHFQDIGAIPLYLRPLTPSGIVRSYLKSGLLTALARPFDSLFAPRSDAEVELVKLTHDNLSIADQFWEAVKDKYPIMVVRDSQYLAYRFLDIPRRRYECYYALADGKPVAFAIGRNMEVAGIRCAMIADFLYVDGCETQAKALLRKLTHMLWKQGADMAGCLMQAHFEEARLLKRAGFFVCPKFMEPQPFLLCVRPLRDTDTQPNILELKNWFFTMADYDVV